MHQVKRCGIKADWRVVDRRTADPEQLTLARQAQIGGSLYGSSRGVHWGSLLQPL